MSKSSATIPEKMIDGAVNALGKKVADTLMSHARSFIGKKEAIKIENLLRIIETITEAEFHPVKESNYYDVVTKACFSVKEEKLAYDEKQMLRKGPSGVVADLLSQAKSHLYNAVTKKGETSELNPRKIIAYWFAVMCNTENVNDQVIMLRWLDRILKEISDSSSVEMNDILRDSYWIIPSSPPSYFIEAVLSARQDLERAIHAAELEKHKSAMSERFKKIDDINTSLSCRHIPTFILNAFSGLTIKGLAVSQLNKTNMLNTFLTAVVFQVFHFNDTISIADEKK